MQNDNQNTPLQPGAPTPQPDVTPPQQPAMMPQTVINPTPAAAPTAMPAQPFASAIPGTPAVDTSQMFAPDMVTTAPVKKTKLPLFLALGIGGALVLAVGGFFAVRVLFGGITTADMDAARTASNSIASNLTTVSFAVSDVDSVSTTAELTQDTDRASKALAEVQKQYLILKASHVQRDATVHQKFIAFEAKWGPYNTYSRNSIKDLKAMVPQMIALTDDMNELTKNAPSTIDGVGAYLTQYKSIVDNASTQAGKLQLTVDDNKQVMAVFKDFLTATSTSIASAQSDLAAKNITKLESDLTAIENSQSTFDSKLSDIQNKADKKFSDLSPVDPFNALKSALSDLDSKISK